MPGKDDTDTYGGHKQLLGADVLVEFWEIDGYFWINWLLPVFFLRISRIDVGFMLHWIRSHWI